MSKSVEQTKVTLDVLRSQSLTNVVRSEVEGLILNGELAPGDHVSEIGLANRLQVSRGPVREACRALAGAGLLEYRVNRGFFVRKLSMAEIADVYDVRACLARLAGQTLAQRIGDDEVAHLAALIDGMDEANATRDVTRFYEFNMEFHNRLIEFTKNGKLLRIHNDLMKELHVYRRRGLVAGHDTEQSNREHRSILEAIKARDAERAGSAMEHHVLQGKARFLAATAGDAA